SSDPRGPHARAAKRIAPLPPTTTSSALASLTRQAQRRTLAGHQKTGSANSLALAPVTPVAPPPSRRPRRPAPARRRAAPAGSSWCVLCRDALANLRPIGEGELGQLAIDRGIGLDQPRNHRLGLHKRRRLAPADCLHELVEVPPNRSNLTSELADDRRIVLRKRRSEVMRRADQSPHDFGFRQVELRRRCLQPGVILLLEVEPPARAGASDR